jgi:hypothetical protein|tara:strand:+ start:3826 stop:4086 length:261 start_codon:yes stop_codon:yes gene_type:complete
VNDKENIWDDARKAIWILEHGWSGKTASIFERVGEQVYVRPIPRDGETLPPWLSRKRRPMIKDDFIKRPSRQEKDNGKEKSRPKHN